MTISNVTVQTIRIYQAGSNQAYADFGVNELMSVYVERTMNEGSIAHAEITHKSGDDRSNPLATLFTWSDQSTRPILKGDTFVAYDEYVIVFRGKINSIDDTGEHLIVLDALDAVYELKGKGHTYVHDHYNARTQQKLAMGYYSTNDTQYLTIEVPKEYNTIDGLYALVKNADDDFQPSLPTNNVYEIEQTLPLTIDDHYRFYVNYWMSIQIKDLGNIVIQSLECPVHFKSNTSGIGAITDITVTVYNSKDMSHICMRGTYHHIGPVQDVTVVAYDIFSGYELKVNSMMYIQVEITQEPNTVFATNAISLKGSSATYTSQIDVRRSNAIQVKSDTGEWSPYYSFGFDDTISILTGDIFPAIKLNIDTYQEITEYALIDETDVNYYYYITAIDTITTLDSTTLYLNTDQLGGLVIGYNGYINKTTIINDILTANEIPFTVPTAMAFNFAYFRCSGTALMDYMELLVNAVNDNNDRNNTIFADDNGLIFGIRKSLYHDDAGRELVIGDDKAIVFSPSKNLQYKQVTETLKGTISSMNNIPTMICLTDYESLKEQGMLNNSASLSSSGNSISDLEETLYADLMNKVSKAWTATCTISGIDYSYFITSGGYIGSGEIVSVTDPTLGLLNYKMQVNSVKYSYNDHKTILTLNSYPIEYQNKITETSSIVAVNGNTRFDMAGDTAVLQQVFIMVTSEVKTDPYASLKELVIVWTDTNDVDHETVADKTIVTSMPNLSTVKVTGIFAPFTKDIKEHGVHTVKLNSTNGEELGSRTLIESKRPDWYSGQTLTVNVEIKYNETG